MNRRYYLIAIVVALTLGLTACSDDSSLPTETRQTELLPPEDVGSIQPDERPSSYPFALELAADVADSDVKSVLAQLPARTMASALVVGIAMAPADAGAQYMVVASWQERTGVQSEFWLIDPDKAAMEPVLTIKQIGDDEGHLYRGYSTGLATVSNGVLTMVDSSKLVMEVVCMALGFMRDFICPLLSLHPIGGLVCTFVSGIYGILC